MRPHHIFIGLVATLGSMACATAPARLDRSGPEPYTRSAATMLTELAPGEQVAVGAALTLVVTRAEARSYEVHLDKPWAFCREEPSDCDGATEEWLRQALGRIDALQAKPPPD